MKKIILITLILSFYASANGVTRHDLEVISEKMNRLEIRMRARSESFYKKSTTRQGKVTCQNAKHLYREEMNAFYQFNTESIRIMHEIAEVLHPIKNTPTFLNVQVDFIKDMANSLAIDVEKGQNRRFHWLRIFETCIK